MPDNIIQVEIRANDAQLSAGLNQASETVQTATAEMTSSATETETATSEAAGGIASAFRTAAASVSESLAAMKDQLGSFAESAQLASGEVGSAMGMLGGALGAGMLGAYLSHLEAGVISMEHLSVASGMTVASLAEMKGAMEQGGVSTKRFSDTMARLSEHLMMAREGSKREVEAFAALGISSEDLANKNFNVQDALMRVADYLHRNGGSSASLGQAYLLLGRQAVELSGWLGQGSDAIKKQMESLQGLGQATQNAVDSVMSLRQSEAQISQTIKQVAMPAFEGLAFLAKGFSELLDVGQYEFSKFMDYLQNGIQGAVEAFTKLGIVVTDLFHGKWRLAMIEAKGSYQTFTDAVHLGSIEAQEDFQKLREKVMQLEYPASESAHHAFAAGMPGALGASAHHGHSSNSGIFAATERATKESARRLEEENRKLMASVDQAMHKLDSMDQRAARVELARMKASEQANAITEQEDARHQVAMLKMKEQELDGEVALGKITADEKIAMQEALEQKIFEIQKKALERRITELDDKDPQYPKLKAQLDAQVEQLEDQHQSRMTTLLQKAEEQRQKEHQKSLLNWEKGFESINRAFEQSMTGIMRGTQSITQAFERMGDSIAASFINSMEQQLMKFIETHLLMRAIGSETAKSQIGQDAGKAASGAYSAVVGIPVIGPVLAPIAAATAFAGVEAFSSFASAAGGQWSVPGIQPTVLHPQEMVLPAPLAEGLRRTVTGGGGGAVHLHVHATDADSVARLFESNGRALANVLRKQVRLGAF